MDGRDHRCWGSRAEGARVHGGVCCHGEMIGGIIARNSARYNLAGAVVVETVSKYRTRSHLRNMRKRCAVFAPSGLVLFTWLTAYTYHCGEGEKVVQLQGQ